MTQLYLNEYKKNLIGKRVCIACREGILRNNISEIISDIKFLSRHNIETTLFHNLPNRFANQKILKKLESRLPETHLIRITPETDFYDAVLHHRESYFKLIFLERRYLVDNAGNKINTLNTERMRNTLATFGDSIGNVNLRGVLERVCEIIEQGLCERIHILPAGKNSIKHELFTVEGTGTMIANNFLEELRQVQTDDEVAIVNRILSMYKKAGFLKPRSKEYVGKYRKNFYVTEIDSIIVGCVEKKVIDEQTVELGAVAISTRFRNQRVGVYTVNAFMEEMVKQGYSRFISLTINPRLQALFEKLGFSKEIRNEYADRQAQSPNVQMFFKIAD